MFVASLPTEELPEPWSAALRIGDRRRSGDEFLKQDRSRGPQVEAQYGACRALQIKEWHNAPEQDHPERRDPVSNLIAELLDFPGRARQGVPMEELTGASSENTNQTLLPPAGEIQNRTPFDCQE
jgi:hypothetical protein